MKDQIYSQEKEAIAPFEFNSDVARCFDDMVERSVPFYNEIHRITLELSERFLRPGDRVYDLGCSTGSTLNLIANKFKDQGLELIGCDNSKAMLEKCWEKFRDNNIYGVDLVQSSIENIKFELSGLVIMNYTLQFVPLEQRQVILERIYASLREYGLFIMSEKIKVNDPIMQHTITDLYYDFKRRNGYSELEIAQKREALENVLVPLTAEEHIERLKAAGFKRVDMLFRWYNFACFVGIK